MKILSSDEIKMALKNLKQWKYVNNAIETTLEFQDFRSAFTAMTRIAFEAESMNHHPDWTNIYNQVIIRLNTHDAGGVTQKDIALATTIQRILAT